MIGSVLAEHLQHRSITIATGPGRGLRLAVAVTPTQLLDKVFQVKRVAGQRWPATRLQMDLNSATSSRGRTPALRVRLMQRRLADNDIEGVVDPRKAAVLRLRAGDDEDV